MATVRRPDEGREAVTRLCDEIYIELTGMRMRLLTMINEMEMQYGEDVHPLRAYKDHLLQLADQIEWKVQILSHACPYEWKGSREKVESTVSVPGADAGSLPEIPAGSVGG